MPLWVYCQNRLRIVLYGKQFSQPAITCSKLTREAQEQGVKYIKSSL